MRKTAVKNITFSIQFNYTNKANHTPICRQVLRHLISIPDEELNVFKLHRLYGLSFFSFHLGKGDFSKINFSASYFTTKLKNYMAPHPPQLSKIYGDFFYNVSPSNQEFIDWLNASNYFESQRSFSATNEFLEKKCWS